MRFALTAKTIAQVRSRGNEINDMTKANIQKVTRFRGEEGPEQLEAMVRRFERLGQEGDEGVEVVRKKRVYHDMPVSR